jgi:hypothetical protein
VIKAISRSVQKFNLYLKRESLSSRSAYSFRLETEKDAAQPLQVSVALAVPLGFSVSDTILRQ